MSSAESVAINRTPMPTKKIGFASALVLGCLVAGSSAALAATPEVCRGGEGRASIGSGPLQVASVHELRTQRQVGKIFFDVKAGVSLLIPAELGVSQAFVERIVGCDLAKGNGVFGVVGVKAKVRQVTGGYVVDLTAPAGKVDQVVQAAMQQHRENQRTANARR